MNNNERDFADSDRPQRETNKPSRDEMRDRLRSSLRNGNANSQRRVGDVRPTSGNTASYNREGPQQPSAAPKSTPKPSVDTVRQQAAASTTKEDKMKQIRAAIAAQRGTEAADNVQTSRGGAFSNPTTNSRTAAPRENVSRQSQNAPQQRKQLQRQTPQRSAESQRRVREDYEQPRRQPTREAESRRRVPDYGYYEEQAPRKSSKAGLWIFITLVVTFVIALIVIYVFGRVKYSDKFLPNTYINGIEVGGMTKSEAEEEILSTTEDMGITFLTKDKEEIVFHGSDFGRKISADEEQLDEIFDQEDRTAWYVSLWTMTEGVVKVESSYSDADLISLIAAYDWGDTPSTDAEIVQNDDGSYSIQPETQGDMVDTTILADYTISMIDQGANTIDMEQADCYKKPEVVSADLEDALEAYNSIGKMTITFDMTDREEMMDPTGTVDLTYDDFKDWLITDGDSYTIDEDAAKEWVETNIAEPYDTYVTGYERTFKSTEHGKITLTMENNGACIYGWETDVDSTVKELVDALEAGESATMEPVYSRAGLRAESKGYGDNTYIEVDICKQHLWFYISGELYYETDIVSGKASDPERATPTGVGMIKALSTDTVLGTYEVQGYEQPVSYWMPFTDLGIGLHDLSRKSYGGDTYLENGSHGCINLPLEAAEKIYNKATVGMPVLVIE